MPAFLHSANRPRNGQAVNSPRSELSCRPRPWMICVEGHGRTRADHHPASSTKRSRDATANAGPSHSVRRRLATSSDGLTWAGVLHEVSAAHCRSSVAGRTFRVVRSFNNGCPHQAFRPIPLFARRPGLPTLAVWRLWTRDHAGWNAGSHAAPTAACRPNAWRRWSTTGCCSSRTWSRWPTPCRRNTDGPSRL